jgi:LytR_cpsA_psr family/LytR cell envelope-related transcriptional attenuator
VSVAPEEDLPPLADWPPPEILARWADRRRQRVRRRAARRRGTALVILIALLVAGAVVLVRSSGRQPARSEAAATPLHGTVALSVNVGLRHLLAVVAVPGVDPPVVVAIPAGTRVDITGGVPVTIDEAAASTSGLLLAAFQAAVDRRLDHYVSVDSTALANVIDALGGVEVEADSEFVSGDRILGPGPSHMTGGSALAYLQQAPDEELTSRWEAVLAGVFGAKGGAEKWRSLFGASDSIEGARSVLGAAAGAIVLELPTAPTQDGGLGVDTRAAAEMVRRHFPAASTGLVRVIVLNGAGRPSVGEELAALVAPAGFKVVSEQDLPYTATQTEIVAAGDLFAPQAERVQSLLGVGMVYVDAQPTGIADITIKVGKDYKAG